MLSGFRLLKPQSMVENRTHSSFAPLRWQRKYHLFAENKRKSAYSL